MTDPTTGMTEDITGTAAWPEAAMALADKVTAAAPEWRDAVCATPRHALVPRWWERIPNSPIEAWEMGAPEFGSKAHLSAAYSDSTLVTRVGPVHADNAQPGDNPTGSPTSSSTLPGLIVSMLHRLDAQPGHKVLDVGTGSGYSAALMAHRLGDNHVTSIDVDHYLTQAARTRIAEFGRRPRIEAIDATGGLPEPEYDRIMATVSVRPVPHTWIQALRPGGRLVTTIAHTALLITAEMGNDGIARGTVQPDPASFMEARQDSDYPPKLNDVFAAARDHDGDDTRPTNGPVPDLWQEWSLRWLYELDTPGVETRAATHPDGKRCVWLLATDGSWARAEHTDNQPGIVHQSGPRRLWDDLEHVRSRWHEADTFSLHSMTAELSPTGSHLSAPNKAWRFAI